jgi:pyruvate dehydrogenase E2 component (dihydrolipoamide acetyltransferase)
MALVDVKVPNIGDFQDVPVIDIQVKPGDEVKADDPLITLATRRRWMFQRHAPARSQPFLSASATR